MSGEAFLEEANEVFGHEEVGSRGGCEAQLDVSLKGEEVGREQRCCLCMKWRKWLYKVSVFLFLISKVVFKTSRFLCLGNSFLLCTNRHFRALNLMPDCNNSVSSCDLSLQDLSSSIPLGSIISPVIASFINYLSVLP